MVIGAGAFLYIKQRPSPEERAAKEKMKQDSIVAAFNAEATVAVTAALEKSRQDALATDEAQKAVENNSNTDGNPNNIFPAQYMAVSKKAYFYDSPDASTARKSFIIKEQTITIFREDGDYYYGSFTYNGRTTEGFMQKKDLQYIKW